MNTWTTAQKRKVLIKSIGERKSSGKGDQEIPKRILEKNIKNVCPPHEVPAQGEKVW